MKITMRKSAAQATLGLLSYDCAIVGPSLDDRGSMATEAVKGSARRNYSLSYDPESMRFEATGGSFDADDLASWLEEMKPKSLVLEATTLGLPEMCLCCRAAREKGLDQISFVYVEPLEYSAPHSHKAIHRRDFELSSEVVGFIDIPGTGGLLDETRTQNVMFFVGYEGQRLEQAFETLKIVPETCEVAFGVPAFNPGWEMDTFANICPVLRERKVQGGVFFCGADNPAAAMGLLERRYRHKRPGDEMFVAPIGTKPHGIGVSLFLSDHYDVGLLYDHPRRKGKRTKSALNWHLFNASWKGPNETRNSA